VNSIKIPSTPLAALSTHSAASDVEGITRPLSPLFAFTIRPS
jgi:hypothetical protein